MHRNRIGHEYVSILVSFPTAGSRLATLRRIEIRNALENPGGIRVLEITAIVQIDAVALGGVMLTVTEFDWNKI